MALLTCSTSLSTTAGSSESSRDKSIELSSAKSCFSWVTGGGFHGATAGLPGRSAAGGLKGAVGAMIEIVWSDLEKDVPGPDADEFYRIRSSAALSYILRSLGSTSLQYSAQGSNIRRKDRSCGLLSSNSTMKLRNRFSIATKAWLEWPDVLDAHSGCARNNHAPCSTSHPHLTSSPYASSTRVSFLPVLPAVI